MYQNSLGEIILSEKEFFEAVGNEKQTILDLIEIYGAETSLMEVLTYLTEHEAIE